MKKLIIAALVLVGLTCQAQKATEKETVVVIKTSMGTVASTRAIESLPKSRTTTSTRKVRFVQLAKATR